MEVKKSKVKELFQFTTDSVDEATGVPTKVPTKDQFGNYSYKVTFENGDWGYWKVSEKNKDYFKVGQEAEYVITEEQKKDGSGNYFRVKIPKADKPFGGSKYSPKKKMAYRAEMISFGFSYAKDMVVSGNIPVKEDGSDHKLVSLAEMLVHAMWKMLDEIEGLE